MITLARKLRTADYFALGFGSMVGAGWLVVMDDWLARGGALGAVLGFAVGGLALVPIGYVYGRLVMEIPDAASEIAYTARVFPAGVSYATGWMMMLAYLIVCPWEAVAVGRIAAYIFSGLNSLPLYRVGGQAVYLPQLALGLALTALITLFNYRGIRLSASLQTWATFAVLGLFVFFASAGVARGKSANFAPLFSHGRVISVLLVLQIVPYFMTGFEAVPKCAEESSSQFRSRGFFRAILAALLVGTAFYTAAIAVVAYVYPWRSLAGASFLTAAAFERAFGSRWIVDVILATALLSLFKVFNGNFIASSRMLYALGRNGMIRARTGEVHELYRTPARAVLWTGLATAAAVLLGDAILIPISEVGALASVVGWLAATSAYFFIAGKAGQRLVAALGALVALLLLGMKLLPFVPGHFSRWEWLALAAWVAAGVGLRKRPARAAAVGEAG